VRVGFREISTAGGVLRVNGQAIKLRGVNRHDEHPDTGRATTPAQWLQDIKLMKAANINYIRLAHYPPSEGFIDLCDELGMYVSNEISMGYGGDQMHNPALAGAALLRSYATVARDINHPSVIIWTVGNEDPLTSLHLAALRTVKGLDPTRPLLMPWRAETWLPPEIHLLSPHYFTASKIRRACKPSRSTDRND
jgi:beta-galactosidase